MPVYTFYNVKTDEVFEKSMKYVEVEKFLADNPDVQKMIDTPGIIGGISMDSGRLPDGFKDRLRLMKQKHPRAKGLDHLL